MSYTVDLKSASSGYDRDTCWVQARAGLVPTHAHATDSGQPTVVLTMQKLLLSGSDVFFGIHSTLTTDLGRTWTPPIAHPTFDRRDDPEGTQTVVCDFTPTWHVATRTLLGTGHTATYHEGTKLHTSRPRVPTYATFDPAQRTWSPWQGVKLPEEPLYHNCGSGSGQRVDLPDGDILLPMYARTSDQGQYRCSSFVSRCGFDGRTITFKTRGPLMTVDVQRGFVEPSVATFNGRYFLSLRNDECGHVARSDDGLHYEQPAPLKFDDGEIAGNYNTQAHWVTHSDALYLVYTRRGLDNDHVFRHRAPLVMAEFDTDNLCLLRETERIIVPQRGARLGNFGVVNVTPDETWVIAAEWMQSDPLECEKHGSNNTVWAARILWDQSNGLFDV